MNKQAESAKPAHNNENKKQAPAPLEQVSFMQLFRFATPLDWVMMIIGTIGSGIDGAAMPLFALLLGNVATDFGPGHTGKQIFDAAATICWEFVLVGVGSWIVSYFGFAFWMISGERQSIEVRKRYFKSLLSQEIAFFDSINPNEMSTKIAEECLSIQQGIGEKVPTFIYSLAMMIIGFLIGYIKGWQLALVMTACVPVIGLTGTIFVISMQKVTRINNEAYGKAGAIAEEVLNAIRTVVSLGGQEKETRRYKDIMASNRFNIYKYSIISGIAMGLLFLSMYGVFALGFYIGAVFVDHKTHNPVSKGPYQVGDVLTVFFSILMASLTPSRAVPSIKAFAIAKVGAAKAYKIIDRKSQISIDKTTGQKLDRIEGNIDFNNVVFAYPLKPDRTILKGATFHIRKNEKTALVGESGCGKTTCIQLIERFYDLLDGNGSITLDGKELKNLNLKWMRENIGYVGQEPVLFATSVKENLMMAKEDATDEEIWQALRRANAYDFVQSLPEKLDTFVGNQGTQLSGGQKQRLAIARAILKNPAILLLDEATSALDRKNEMEIQKTLDEISEGRTTIVIAHRLSTIINSNHIIVFDEGRVVEEGRHAELIDKKGRYYTLQHMQIQAEEKEKEKASKQGEEEVKPANQQTRNSSNNNEASPIMPRMPSDKKKSEKQGLTTVQLDDGQVAPSEAHEHGQSSKGPKQNVFRRLFKYNHEDIHLIAIGVFAGLVHGLNTPMNAILLANMIEVLALIPYDHSKMKRAQYFAFLFMANAIVALFSNAVQTSCFNIVSENLSRKIRGEVFEKYVRMPIGWFDDPRNSPGVLGSRLTTDATLVNTLTGSIFGVYVQALSSFITGLIIGFIASWQLTLVGLGVSPLMVLSGKIRAQFSQSYNSATDEYYQESIAFVSEAVNNMRTVASFGKEGKLFDNYSKKLDVPLKAATKNGHMSGFAFGIGQFLNFLVYAIVFLIGGLMMQKINLSFKHMFQSVLGVMFAAMGMGNALQFAPDVGAAKNAALHIFKVLDAVPAIDIDDPSQDYRKPIKGDIEFRNIWFKYPSREKQIFSGLNLKIAASTKVALVGPSGCGKSTILALLQRFYDADQGEVLIDGVNIKKYDLKFLRESFGVVSQEPTLFNGTIEYNIKYSKEHATDEEMRQAATKASALGFIENNEFDAAGDEAQAAAKFGTGFHRKVGPKGSQMSGGQKQRIAIARAIMKNPSLLILDEATSALDVQNEKIVQESLDKIMEGKTSVIVAHRISTIKDADQIVVFNEGQIVEKGTYAELNAMKGLFYKLERGLSTTQ